MKPDGSTNYRGVVMLIHGGFWKAGYDRSLMIEIADDLVAQNFCVWNVDYRSAAWCDIFCSAVPLFEPHLASLKRVGVNTLNLLAK